MKRVRFFDGQMLSAADFAAEQTYHREKRRLHNRLLHGAGVVQGLTIHVEDMPATSGAALSVRLTPGFALDEMGNEIVVDVPVLLDTSGAAGDSCFAVLRYTETETDPSPLPTGGVAFTRVTESFSVALEAAMPAPGSGPIVLARLRRVNGHWTADTSCRHGNPPLYGDRPPRPR